jgi:biotin operon repressor
MSEIQVPRRPRLRPKDYKPPERKFSVLPARIAYDRTVSDGAIRTLVALTQHCNRAGITWISQAKLADKMGISRTALTTSMAKLRKAGYVQVIRKGFRGHHNNTLRVVYDPAISADEAIAIASSAEDCRPPAQIIEEQDMTPEEQRAKIARMLQGIVKPFGAVQPAKPYKMPKDGETLATKRIRAGLKKGNTGLPTRAHAEGVHETAQTDPKSLRDYIQELGVRVEGDERLYVKVIEDSIPHELAVDLIAQVGERYRREGLQPPRIATLVDAVTDLYADHLLNAPGSPTAHDRGQG